jgi:phosphatidylserine/phosphatidylglycerophosphate/cardiolipin synthase-like enzyme
LTSPYFISSWKIRRALRYAAKKGVDVRLILPGKHSDHKWVTFAIHRYYTRLIRAKIKIYEFQPRFSHSKIILCDDWFTIGSSNLDLWNQYLNLDANIEIYDQSAHSEIKNLFELNFKTSKLISSDEWSARSFVQRLKELASGIVISILGYIGRKFKR